MNAQELEDLLLSILDKNISLAMDLFKWLKRIKPSLRKEWEDEFERQYGKGVSERDN